MVCYWSISDSFLHVLLFLCSKGLIQKNKNELCSVTCVCVCSIYLIDHPSLYLFVLHQFVTCGPNFVNLFSFIYASNLGITWTKFQRKTWITLHTKKLWMSESALQSLQNIAKICNNRSRFRVTKPAGTQGIASSSCLAELGWTKDLAWLGGGFLILTQPTINHHCIQEVVSGWLPNQVLSMTFGDTVISPKSLSLAPVTPPSSTQFQHTPWRNMHNLAQPFAWLSTHLGADHGRTHRCNESSLVRQRRSHHRSLPWSYHWKVVDDMKLCKWVSPFSAGDSRGAMRPSSKHWWLVSLVCTSFQHHLSTFP